MVLGAFGMKLNTPLKARELGFGMLVICRLEPVLPL